MSSLEVGDAISDDGGCLGSQLEMLISVICGKCVIQIKENDTMHS